MRNTKSAVIPVGSPGISQQQPCHGEPTTCFGSMPAADAYYYVLDTMNPIITDLFIVQDVVRGVFKPMRGGTAGHGNKTGLLGNRVKMRLPENVADPYNLT